MTLPTETERAEGRAAPAFLAFLALMTSVIAMTIDAVLPALDAISGELGFAGRTTATSSSCWSLSAWAPRR